MPYVDKEKKAADSAAVQKPTETPSKAPALLGQVKATAGMDAQTALLKPPASPGEAATQKTSDQKLPSSTPWSKVIRDNFSRIDKNADGFISQAEANDALSDPGFTGTTAAAVAALRQFLDLLEELSNDELLDEDDGLTLADLDAYEKGALAEKLQGNLAHMEGSYQGGTTKIRGARRELFPNGVPSLSSLRQGGAGDCYFLAALGSYIARDPAALTRMIVENHQKDKVVSYTVTFPGNLGAVTVNPPTDGEIAQYGSAGMDGLWLIVMEKAYAVARAGTKTPDIDKEIGQGGLLSTGMNPFTAAGTDNDILSLTAKSTTIGKLDAAFGRSDSKAKKRMVTATIQSENDYELPESHAYSVIGWDGTSLTIRNPWGFLEKKGKKEVTGPSGQDAYATGVFVLTLDEFDRVFFDICYEE